MPTADYSSYHQLPGTGADGTKFDNFIDAVQTTVNALDKNNLAAAAGILAAQLADPTTGKVLGSSGSACAAVYPPGYVYDYVEFVADVTVSATTEGGADVIKTGTATTFDGSTVVNIEFFAAEAIIIQNAAGNKLTFVLYEDGSSIGLLGAIRDDSGSNQISAPVHLKRRRTPASGSRTYSVRGFRSNANGTVKADVGGSGKYMPGYLMITKV